MSSLWGLLFHSVNPPTAAPPAISLRSRIASILAQIAAKPNRKAVEFVLLVLTQGALLWYVWKMISRMDIGGIGSTNASGEGRSKAVAVLRLRGKTANNIKSNAEAIKNLRLTQYEELVAREILVPQDSSVDPKTSNNSNIATREISQSAGSHPTVTFADIGGLEEMIAHLKEAVILPLKFPQLFEQQNALLSAPKGVLLYGPPGCGKTMTAKALAQESGATFINLQPSTLQDKWYGQTNKLVAALFSLAQKLKPSIIFIDEIDALLRTRQSTDHEASALLKAEFMALWDGIATSSGVVIVGSTNRINDIDEAILRRLPTRFLVSLPSESGRYAILAKTLQQQQISASFSMHALAKVTHGFSGSELKELCQSAAMRAVREYLNRMSGSSAETLAKLAAEAEKGTAINKFPLRPLTMSDFIQSETLRKRYQALPKEEKQ